MWVSSDIPVQTIHSVVCVSGGPGLVSTSTQASSRKSGPALADALALCKFPQWGATDAGINVPSAENTELKGSSFKTWSRSVYSRAFYTYSVTARDFFLAYFYPFGPFTCIFSKTSAEFFMCLAVANTSSCAGPQNKIGHPIGCRFLF